jgi:hypothetical protein
MQKCNRGNPYARRQYYRVLSGETEPRRVVALPPQFAADVGESIAQISLGDGTGIVQIKKSKPGEVTIIERAQVIATETVRSKRNGADLWRYTLIDPSIYMRNDMYYAYEDDGTLWLVPIGVHDAWRAALPEGTL